MKEFLLLLLMLGMLGTATICWGQTPTAEAEPRTETTYDAIKDRTTVRLAPIKISGEKDQYHSLHLAPAFSFPGHKLQTPAIIDFELQLVVKRKLLDSDLYVDFLIDGEKIFLSSSRWAVKHPVPGRLWMGERLVFRMPYETYLKLAQAKIALVRFEGLAFEFDNNQRSLLKAFAEKMRP